MHACVIKIVYQLFSLLSFLCLFFFLFLFLFSLPFVSLVDLFFFIFLFFQPQCHLSSLFCLFALNSTKSSVSNYISFLLRSTTPPRTWANHQSPEEKRTGAVDLNLKKEERCLFTSKNIQLFAGGVEVNSNANVILLCPRLNK